MRIYLKPISRIVSITATAVMDDVIEVSGEYGPTVNPDPIDPVPGNELINHTSVWEEYDDEK